MCKKNVLFSDANHGGLVLLEEYSKHTNNNLFFYDIYNKLSSEEKKSISSRLNVRFLTLDEVLADEDSFVKVNPVHMPPHFKTDYTHHEFVSYLLAKMGVDFKLIQVTGVKGKTTVCSMLREVFSDFNTLVLTSEQLTFNGNVLMENLSIAPASIITSVNRAIDEGLVDSIDYAIFEVSLGVVPGGFINVLTNILEDYSIAGDSSSASVAKSSVFTSEYTVCDYDSCNMFYSDEKNVITLSFDDCDADIFASNIDYNFENTSFVMNYFDKEYKINLFALSDFYVNNLLFAISVGLLSDIDVNTIISKLSNFNSVDGRNSYRVIGDKVVIEDINPGLNTTSIKKCIANLTKYDMEYTVVIGGDYGITCEEIDEEKLTNYLKTLTDTDMVFCGELGENLLKILDGNYHFFNTLKEATNFCLNENDKKIIQVIYRSNYFKNKDELL